MNKFLNGNYEINKIRTEENKSQVKDFTKLFESKALEKLGGSIAFVMKSNKFLWDGGEDAQ